jgi:hydroxypyruvate isomerase
MQRSSPASVALAFDNGKASGEEPIGPTVPIHVMFVNHSQVQLLYDLFHEQVAEGSLIEEREEHINVIGLIHVADVPGRHEPGTGEINYNNIYRKLVELNYHGMVAMEFKPTGDPVLALRAAKEFALSQV